MKPSDTRWLSHERCVKAIFKEPPPLIQTLSQLDKSSGDAEAYIIYTLLASVNDVTSSYHLSEVLSTFPFLNFFMQKKILEQYSIRRVIPVGVLQLRQPYRT